MRTLSPLLLLSSALFLLAGCGKTPDQALQTQLVIGTWHNYQVTWLNDDSEFSGGLGLYLFKRLDHETDTSKDLTDMQLTGQFSFDGIHSQQIYFVQDHCNASRGKGFYVTKTDKGWVPMFSATVQVGKATYATGQYLQQGTGDEAQPTDDKGPKQP
jgi:hypothetical protein